VQDILSGLVVTARDETSSPTGGSLDHSNEDGLPTASRLVVSNHDFTSELAPNVDDDH
jgi:hypothetical protein